MDWRDYCVEELAKHRCFVSALHKQRFIELFEMVRNEPFLTKEICKCMFLAAWDRRDTDEMEEIFRKMIEENVMDANRLKGRKKRPNITPNEEAINLLARQFMENPGKTPDESCLIRLSKAWIPLGDCALEVSDILDRL